MLAMMVNWFEGQPVRHPVAVDGPVQNLSVEPAKVARHRTLLSREFIGSEMRERVDAGIIDDEASLFSLRDRGGGMRRGIIHDLLAFDRDATAHRRRSRAARS